MGGLMIILAVVITCISMTIRQGVGSEMGILLVSFVLYIIIYKVTPDAKTDAKVVAELGK